MRIIENPTTFRTNIVNKLKTELNDEEIIAKNLEKGIYNYCIKAAGDKNIIKKWDNMYFTQLYIDCLRTILFNLKKEVDIKKSILNKTIKAHEFAFMTHQEMNSSKWQSIIENKMKRDKSKYETRMEASTDTFTCRRCKSKECTYYQMQTRSADEPMTTFVTCINCNNRWKC